MSTWTHEEYRENIGPYVLGALPELEVELVERHLVSCDSCRADVEDLRPVSAAIARSVPQIEAPASLKTTLMAIVNAEAEVRADEPARARRRRERLSFAQWFAGLTPRTAAAMAVAVLALGVVIGVGADKLGGSTTTKTVAAQIDRKLMPTGVASLDVKGDKAKLTLTDAPQPPSGRVYQLWYQHGKTIERGGTFKPRADGSYQADLSVSHANAVMVTVEKMGGAAAPTGPPIMQFNT